ncbi:MAG: hypothetical protein JW892_05740 [Anaerolineae bacterium]|nr:hypothetical protein [Anaerolineae bacterium]
MPTSGEERLTILRLLQEGKITPQDASRLLEALDNPVETPSITSKKAHWLHIRVTDVATGKVRVNVTLPAAMLRAGLKLGSRFTSDLDALDPEMLSAFLAQGEAGMLIDVVDEKDGEHVEVFLD